MPVKFRRKNFVINGMYHIYIRGIDGKTVFSEARDYECYRRLLEKYLMKGEENTQTIFKGERPYLKRHREEMNLENELELLSYCLMPDHIHLLVRQRHAEAMTKLMRRVGTAYVMYFNKKYKRRGTLFEGIYKAAPINAVEDAVYVSRMIHINPAAAVRRFGPVETKTGPTPEEYMYSSLGVYLDNRKEGFVKPDFILMEFSKGFKGRWGSYRSFVGDYKVGVDEGWKGAALD